MIVLVYSWAFCSVPVIYVSLCWYYTVLITTALQYSLKLGVWWLLLCSWISKVFFPFWHLFKFFLFFSFIYLFILQFVHFEGIDPIYCSLSFLDLWFSVGYLILENSQPLLLQIFLLLHSFFFWYSHCDISNFLP